MTGKTSDAESSSLKALRERCAQVADAEYNKWAALADMYRLEGREDSMDRCFARARASEAIAANIRAVTLE